MLIFLILFFFVGLFIGSFLNVLIDRLHKRENVLTGRSHCDYCLHTLSWPDLIPLVSFVILRGKCRYCHKRLSLYYPVVELVTAALFALTFFVLQQNSIMYYAANIKHTTELIYYLLIISALIVIFFTDLKYGTIPFSMVCFAVLAASIYMLLNTYYLIPNLFLSGIGAFISFLFLFLVTRGRGIGFGDVIYVFLMGFILGFPKVLLGLYISFIVGAIISLILVLLKKKKLKGGTIPFGPFLVTGTVICLFWGNEIISKILPYLLPQ